MQPPTSYRVLSLLALGGAAARGGAPGASRPPASGDTSAAYLDVVYGDQQPPASGLWTTLVDRTGSVMRRWQRRLPIPSPAEDVGWTLRELPPPRANATSAFYRVLAHVQANVHSSALDSRYVYIFVPGLFANTVVGYFRQALDRLRHLGLDARYVSLDSSTDASASLNAARLRLALTNIHRGSGGRKLVIIAHSKGMIDTSLALALYPELRRVTHAVVSLQAPFGGAAIAEDIMHGNPAASQVLEQLLQRFDLGISSLHDMTYRHRRAVLAAHDHLRALHPSIRVVSLGSRAPRSLAHALALTNLYVSRMHGAENDGLVCVADALLPQSLAIIANDMDHGMPVLPALPGARLKGSDIVEAAVTVALMPDAELALEPWQPASRGAVLRAPAAGARLDGAASVPARSVAGGDDAQAAQARTETAVPAGPAVSMAINDDINDE